MVFTFCKLFAGENRGLPLSVKRKTHRRNEIKTREKNGKTHRTLFRILLQCIKAPMKTLCLEMFDFIITFQYYYYILRKNIKTVSMQETRVPDQFVITINDFILHSSGN